MQPPVVCWRCPVSSVSQSPRDSPPFRNNSCPTQAPHHSRSRGPTTAKRGYPHGRQHFESTGSVRSPEFSYHDLSCARYSGTRYTHRIRDFVGSHDSGVIHVDHQHRYNLVIQHMPKHVRAYPAYVKTTTYQGCRQSLIPRATTLVRPVNILVQSDYHTR